MAQTFFFLLATPFHFLEVVSYFYVVLYYCRERAKSEHIAIITVSWLFSSNILNSDLDQDNSRLVSADVVSMTALRSSHFQRLKTILCVTHPITTFTLPSWGYT